MKNRQFKDECDSIWVCGGLTQTIGKIGGLVLVRVQQRRKENEMITIKKDWISSSCYDLTKETLTLNNSEVLELLNDVKVMIALGNRANTLFPNNSGEVYDKAENFYEEYVYLYNALEKVIKQTITEYKFILK